MTAIAEKRVDIKLGFTCNNNCRFCVQAHKRNFGDKTTDRIKMELDLARNTGCSGVVFTGGEPSIRKDILELITYAKELGFNTIQLQTNGRRFFYKDFCERVIRAGMNEFSPALHGHTAGLHDYLTSSPGSFEQTVQAIKNIAAHDSIRIISNTVVTKPNYRYLPDIARLLVSLGVDQYQLAFVHAVGNARKNFDEMVPRVSEAAPFIHEALQAGIDAGLIVMAEAMPFCTMQGYERYVSELYIPPTEIRDADMTVPDFKQVR